MSDLAARLRAKAFRAALDAADRIAELKATCAQKQEVVDEYAALCIKNTKRIAELDELYKDERKDRLRLQERLIELEARPELTAEQVGYLVELIDGPYVTCFQADLLEALGKDGG